ncbi:MAG: hypothetical protein OXH61_09710 [Acidimicrobiaceae bacterium]|nr:hypothetical protein [Acidimicrobiaceae bacterium]
MPPPEKFTQGSRLRLLDPPVQLGCRLANLTVFASVSLPVALEAAAVHERQQSAAEFVRFEPSVEGLGSQAKGIKVPGFAPFRFVGGQQAEVVECLGRQRTPLDHAIPIPSHSPFHATVRSV